jgi:hypothetical protein
MSKESKAQAENDTSLTITIFIIGGVILIVAAVVLLVFPAGFPR